MVKFIVNHLYIIFSILFGVSSQLIVKWKMNDIGFMPEESVIDKILVALGMLSNPYILLSIFLTFCSGISWMIAMTKFDIGYAYPYMSFGFVLVILFSYLFFNEPLSFYRIVGVLFIVVGIFIVSQDLS